MIGIQRVAQLFGIVFIVVAIWGFVVSGGSMEADPAMAPKILGLFAVNLLHNLVHLGFGIWGLAASRSFAGAKSYGRIAGALYLVLALLGFVIPTTFGLIPIGGNDIWLHALLGVALVVAAVTAKPGGAPAASPPPAV